MKQWPEDKSQAVDFEELSEPLANILKTNTPDSTDVYNLGGYDLACCFDSEYALSKDGLEYHKERGRDLTDVVVMLAIQLGIEQGRRMEANRRKTWVDIAKRELEHGELEGIKYALESLLMYL